MKFTVFTPKTKPLLGVDIGTTFIKAVLLAPGKQPSEWQCHGIACELIPTSAFKERDILDFDSIVITLKQIMLKLSLKQQATVIAVSGSAVISKMIRMPKQLNDLHLEEHIHIEADSLIPYQLEHVYWDFERVPQRSTHSHFDNVLLTVAHKQLVDNRMTVVREAGLKPVIVDTELDALENLVLFNNDHRNSEDATIHVGNELMHIIVVKNNQVLYSKEHQFGIHSLLQDIALTQQCSVTEILNKLSQNVLNPQWQTDVLPIFYAQLTQQILRVCQLVQDSLDIDSPQRIHLCGGVGMLPNITQSLSQALALEVNLLDPTTHMSISDKVSSEQLEACKPMLCIATGLALRNSCNGIH